MAIYKRGRTYWYHFWFDDKHVQESTRQGNPRVARQMEAAHRTALAKGEAGFREKKPIPTLSDFSRSKIEPWARAEYEQTSRNTWLWYRAGLAAICEYAPLSKTALDEIRPEHIADFTANLQSRPKKSQAKSRSSTFPRKTLEVSSVNAVLRILRRTLRLAVEWGVISSASRVKLLRGEKHRERVVTAEEEARYLASASELLAAIATVLVDSGLRPEECYRLRWEHITWVNGRHGSLLVTHGKTPAARRVVPFTPRVRALLQSRWDAFGSPTEGWVWPAPTRSGHADHGTIKKHHSRALKVSGVHPFVLYSLRHTFLTRLGESGVDPWTLARIAGHSNISISARYVHPGQDSVLLALSKYEQRPAAAIPQ
jgi:integrase